MIASEEEIKKAEARGYSKGYQAGTRRKDRDATALERQRRKNEFFNATLIAMLPTAMEAEDWTSGGKKISGMVGRTKLAVDFANEATKYWRDDA